MREWRDKGIILRYGHFHENDLWLKVLLEQHGLQTLFAFGGAKSRRRFCGCLDQLNTLECLARASRTGEFLNLKEATLVASPKNLRKNWQNMGIAINCALFLEACAITPENSSSSFKIFENLRDRLESNSEYGAMLPMFFRLRIASAIGFAPSFTTCSHCGKIISGPGYFIIEDGQMICEECKRDFQADKRFTCLTDDAVHLLDHLQTSLPCEWSWARICEADLRAAIRSIDEFVQFHLGLEWENGRFRRI